MDTRSASKKKLPDQFWGRGLGIVGAAGGDGDSRNVGVQLSDDDVGLGLLSSDNNLPQPPVIGVSTPPIVHIGDILGAKAPGDAEQSVEPHQTIWTSVKMKCKTGLNSIHASLSSRRNWKN